MAGWHVECVLGDKRRPYWGTGKRCKSQIIIEPLSHDYQICHRTAILIKIL